MHFFQNGLPSFFALFSTICGTIRTQRMGTGGPVSIFGGAQMEPGPHLRVREAHFGKEGVVCVCGAVCVCGRCHGVFNDVLNNVFALCL